MGGVPLAEATMWERCRLYKMAKWSAVWAFELECVDIPMHFGREIQWLVVTNLQQMTLNMRFTKQAGHANVAVNS